ncbi:cyclophilin-like fold protein [Arundinibacter roseus]|uniref:Cyclophilin-like domain-containing protein n=1 Tax=Arundinibacter roseus TaxID=2070510 RepID=A0A4R4K841_9BACT|nr:cyclophilin-like fold protein [Arundinibacter roseus]TDB62716.1 hypothetical protein EZE20_17415 [Arundinibacter roseus]
MKHSLTVIFFLLIFGTGFASCDKTARGLSDSDTGKLVGNMSLNPKGNKMKIKIGTSTFTATLEDNPTSSAFKALLPLTLTMKELNGNEKFFELSSSLPTNAANPKTIQNGDLMLYGSNTLVLFYKTIPTSYSYTRLGRVSDPTGLAALVGSKNVNITFELE